MSFDPSAFDINAFLQPLLITLIQVLVPILASLAIAWLKKQFDLTKAKIPGEQLAFAEILIRQFVMAAEQSGLTGALINEGKVKKAWVRDRVQQELSARGIKLNVNLISDMIEAIVLAEFNRAKLDKPVDGQG